MANSSRAGPVTTVAGASRIVGREGAECEARLPGGAPCGAVDRSGGGWVMSTLITPICTMSPGSRRCAPVQRTPPTTTPLEEPVSSTCNWPW